MNMLAASRLPLAIEEIDAAWVTAALRTNFPDVTVEKLDIVDIVNGTCTKIRLRLEVNEAGRRAGIPEMLMFKGGFEKHSRDMGYMHEYEVRGYKEVLPVLGLPSPICYFADFDDERQQGVILMEDLVASGASLCHPLRPNSYEEVARRLEVLAQFHARTWGSAEELANGKWGSLGDYIELNRYYAHAKYLDPATWQHFIDLPRGAAASVRFQDRDWMAYALDKLVTLSKRLPHCVLHGDTHLGNLYVARDGTPGFFDSLPLHGPCMAEVSYHIVCALDSADRPRWEHALVAHYLEALASHGIDRPDFDESMRQYGANLSRVYYCFVINEPVFQPEAINTAYVSRINAAMIDNDTIRLLDEI